MEIKHIAKPLMVKTQAKAYNPKIRALYLVA
jgi:hypothetical protein